MTPIAQRTGPSDKYPGAEPLPGYRLLEPLGRGGFGEVWKCEAPGGLHKAVKFVSAGGEQFRQELAAFEQVKAIRHPYLLTLERVELTGGELVMVMELADGQIHDRFRLCQSEGLPGIPREELLGYLDEAAEALDMMSNRYGLQHLDVKPDNLFLVAGHVKVGDYGLVRRKETAAASDNGNHGFTPRYVAPEVLRGQLDTRSDQYSLALVYTELLTGSFPYLGQTAQQLMCQHVGAAPDLSALPSSDRAAVGRALSKDPAGRFPSCAFFIRALASAKNDPTAADGHRRWDPGTEGRPGGAVPDAGHSTHPPPDVTVATRLRQPVDGEPEPSTEQTPGPHLQPTVVTRRADRREGARRGDGRRERVPTPEPDRGIQVVLSVDQLQGTPVRQARPSELSRADFVAAVVEAAARDVPLTSAFEVPPEEAQLCRFLSTLPAALVPLKLVTVAEQRGMSVDQRDPSRVVLRWEANLEPRKTNKGDSRGAPTRPRAGYEVVVHRPAPASAEFTVIGSVFGSPDDEFDQKAREDVPAILEEVRRQLQNLKERRTYPRFPATFPVLVYPLYSDGVVGAPIGGRCRDVSAGGVRFATRTPIRTERIFVEFREVPPVAGQAALLGVIRTWSEAGDEGFMTAGRFLSKG